MLSLFSAIDDVHPMHMHMLPETFDFLFNITTRIMFFAEYFRTLVKDFTECQKTFGKLRIEKNRKQQNIFKNYRNNSPTTTHYHTHRPIIFHYYFESNLHVLWMVRFELAQFFIIILNQIYIFCEW
jgi:hypothetical protein